MELGRSASQGGRLSQINRLINLHICTLHIIYFQRDAAASGCIPRSHQPGRAELPPLGTGASAAGRGAGQGMKRSKSSCVAGGVAQAGQGPSSNRGCKPRSGSSAAGHELRASGPARWPCHGTWVFGSSLPPWTNVWLFPVGGGCSPWVGTLRFPRVGWHRGARPQAAAQLSSPGQCLTRVFTQSERAAV